MGLSWSLSPGFSQDFRIDNVELHGLGSPINCLGRRVTSYATRDAKEIVKLPAMVPFCKVFAWCPTAAEIIV